MCERVPVCAYVCVCVCVCVAFSDHITRPVKEKEKITISLMLRAMPGPTKDMFGLQSRCNYNCQLLFFRFPIKWNRK